MRKPLALLLSCLALGLVVAACGDDDEEAGDTGTPAEQPADTDTGEGAPAEGDQTDEQEADEGEGGTTVSMVDIKYDPEEITVKVGDTVTWTNDDPVPHTVTYDSGPGEEFDSGNVDSGGTFEHTFEEAGTVDYLCELHPGQTGKVIVEE